MGGLFFSSSFAGLDTREWKQAAGGRLLWLLVSQMICAAGVVSTRNSSGRRMGESVLCGFITKDLQDTIWPHLVVSVL